MAGNEEQRRKTQEMAERLVAEYCRDDVPNLMRVLEAQAVFGMGSRGSSEEKSLVELGKDLLSRAKGMPYDECVFSQQEFMLAKELVRAVVAYGK